MSVGRLLIISLIFSSIWVGTSGLINFVIVRMVFSSIDDFFQAGKLGMKLFSSFNNLELLMSSVILLVSGISSYKMRNLKFLLFFSAFLSVVVIFYIFFLTPKITELTLLWEKADLMGLSGINGIVDIQQEHQFYHRLYIILDTIKLLILVSFITFTGIQLQRAP